MRRSHRERLGLLAAAALLTAASAAWFTAHPSHVLVGRQPIDDLVPVVYHACVFPVFWLMASAWAVDAAAKRAAVSLGPRAALLAASSALALVRLAGALPLSGHAVFLCAALVYDRVAHGADDLPLVRTAALAGLVVTGWYKLAVWHDPAWFLASIASGCALGGAIGLWRRPFR